MIPMMMVCWVSIQLDLLHVEIISFTADSRCHLECARRTRKQSTCLRIEANIRLAAQQFAEEALCPIRVFDRLEDRSDTELHELKSLATSRD
jgi:hypothetical protein